MVVWNTVKRISHSAVRRVGSFYIFLTIVLCGLNEKKISCVMWNEYNLSPVEGKLFPELFNLKDYVAVSVVGLLDLSVFLYTLEN